MIYDTKSLADALINGEDPDKLAQEFTKALNDAIAQKKARESSIQEQNKIEELADIVEDLFFYMSEHFPDALGDLTLTREDYKNMAKEILKEIGDFMKLIPAAKKVATKLTDKKKSADEIFAEFFKMNDLL